MPIISHGRQTIQVAPFDDYHRHILLILRCRDLRYVEPRNEALFAWLADSAVRIPVGFYTHSLALIADAFHYVYSGPPHIFVIP